MAKETLNQEVKEEVVTPVTETETETETPALREFKIKVGQATNKETGEKFPTFRTTAKNGRFIRVKFRKEVENVPLNDCTVFCEQMKCSLDTNRQYPILWIHEIDHTEALYQPNVAEEKAKAKLDEYFE